MIRDTGGDFFSFVLAIGVGIVFSLVFDVIKAARQTKAHGRVAIFIEDVMFSAFVGVSTYLLQFLRTSGEVRWFLLLGILLGFVVSRVLVSALSVRLFRRIFLLIKRWLLRPLRAIFVFVSSILSKFIRIIFAFLEKILKKLLKDVHNLLYTGIVNAFGKFKAKGVKNKSGNKKARKKPKKP